MTKDAKDIRKKLLKISSIGHDGNLQSGFSSIEILWTLYDKVLELTPENFLDENRNRFILSKGQSTEALLEILSEKGFISADEMKNFCKIDSRISMQADRTKLPMVEISAGSLGHGLPMACGIAWANKIKNIVSQVFCLVGDGEMNEGTMWESLIFASSENLNNLTVIVDDNNSITRLIKLNNFKEKFESFGFDVITVDGHNEDELLKVFTMKHDKPLCVLAKTIRGYGSKTLMEDRSWFHRYPKGDELDMLLAEVDAFQA